MKAIARYLTDHDFGNFGVLVYAVIVIVGVMSAWAGTHDNDD